MLEEKRAPLEGPAEGEATLSAKRDADESGQQIDHDRFWLSLAKEANDTSVTYMDTVYREQFHRNLANFKNKHPEGSKYYKDAYKHRSKLFRPKIRTSIRQAEASYADAAFASRESFSVEPSNPNDQGAAKIAEVKQAILNYRLKNSIPWYLISVAAFQETKVYGAVVSKQYWDVDLKIPVVALLPIENCRWHPSASWLDPVNTSPYFVEAMPMYVDDVMEQTPEMGWREYSRDEIIKHGVMVQQSDKDRNLRSQREGNKQDPKDPSDQRNVFRTVWVHRNFIKHEGQDYEYYTLGTNAILSEPVPLTPETHPIGRPYKFGISNIEAHRIIPCGDTELAQDLQVAANDIQNQRMDNIRLVLNKGYIINRNSKTDIATAKRSYPGRIILTDDPKAVQPDEMHDVTSSSYAEQDRLNHDLDDILGGFSGSSVASDRKLNETVGGMEMFRQSGNKVQGFSVRTFVETWVEPVLNDIVLLQSLYEPMEIVNMFSEGLQEDQMLISMTVSVNVGLGPLDPQHRASALVEAIIALGKVAPHAMPFLDVKSVAAELFGAIGHRDGARFFPQLPDGPPKPQGNPEAEIKGQELQLKEQEITMRGQIEMARLEQEREIKMMDLALKHELTMEALYSKLDLDERKHNLDIMKELGNLEQIQRDREEMKLKEKMGEGI